MRLLARGALPLDDFVVSKGLSKPVAAYANPEQQVHLVVNARRAARAPGTEYRLGDRVPYVIVHRASHRPGAPVRQLDAAEDAEYAREHGLRPSTDYYVNNQLRKPLTRIFDTVWGVGASDALLFTRDVLVAPPPPNRFFASSAALDAMRRLVDTWTRRPRAATSAFFVAEK
jgi:DNA polymerase delta subunit 1